MRRWTWSRGKGRSTGGEAGKRPLTNTAETVKLPGHISIDLRMRVHVFEDGEQAAAISSTMQLLRGMMRGPAAGVFCDQFEVALRQSVEHAVTAGQQPGDWRRKPKPDDGQIHA